MNDYLTERTWKNYKVIYKFKDGVSIKRERQWLKFECDGVKTPNERLVKNIIKNSIIPDDDLEIIEIQEYKN